MIWLNRVNHLSKNRRGISLSLGVKMKKTTGIAIALMTLFAHLAPAHADEMNIKVAAWDAQKSTLTTAAGTIIMIDQSKVTIPDTLSVGDEVLIDFNSSEDGFTGITAFTVTKDN